MTTSSIAIAHKHYPERGGAEIVADELARGFDAPIYTGYDNDAASSDNEVHELLDGWERRLATSHYLLRDLYYMRAWSIPPLEDYDVILQSGNGPGWYVPEDRQTVIRYTHSTPRTGYDLFQSKATRLIAWAYSKAMHTMYSPTVPWVDHYVANSDLVARRLQRYWGIPDDKLSVVYPPVPVSTYDPRPGGDYYIALSRLDQDKGFPYIISAFQQLNRAGDYPLRIVGDGPLRNQFEQQAAGCDAITFDGYVSEDRKRELLAGARALVYAARNEDFGMVPVEAMAAGTPVIGVKEGFTQDQIIDGANGTTYPREGGHLREAVRSFERNGAEWTPEEMHAFSQRFSRDRFHTQMQAIVERVQHDTRVMPPWRDDVEWPEPVDAKPAVPDGGQS